MSGARLRVAAPAKLNLCLYVGARRDDGLHELCSLFQSVTLADTIVAEPASGSADEVVCPAITGPNLAAEALARFRERFEWHGPPLRLTIEKSIPTAAGLGGGSADAAAVLRLALGLSGRRPAENELSALALELGADVPSQLSPGTHLVRGAGERVEPLEPLTRLAAVVLCGRGRLSTRDVYAKSDTLRAPRDDLDALAQELRAAAAGGGDPLALAPLLQNDLQEAAVALEPAAGEALRLLARCGARAALVTGSGPAAFGLFASHDEAEQARGRIAPEWAGDAIVVGTAGPQAAAPTSVTPST